ncbi:hypothetical protein BRC74_01585 [Halobacteriales archaeon QH_7_68_42]|nr:MAG: hypothetical protein BRC74_01585 [Halobacteriales archaeon QH_7_68_42]
MAVTRHRIVSGDDSEIHDEPHIEGSRVTVLHIHERVENRGLRPETVAERLNLDLADVYDALAYYHRNPEEMQAVEERRQTVAEEVFHRLRDHSHDVRHVDLSDELSKGDSDDDLAAFSHEYQFVIVTYDDDFRDDFTEDEYHAVFYLPDQTLSAETIADVLHEISIYYQQSDLQGFMTIGKSWV